MISFITEQDYYTMVFVQIPTIATKDIVIFWNVDGVYQDEYYGLDKGCDTDQARPLSDIICLG